MSCTVLVVTKAEDIPTKCIDGKPTLVYWNIMGLAQAIRLSLVAAKVDFVDVRIEAGDADLPEYRKAWEAKKHTTELLTALVFPNLPYFFHPALPSDRGLVQSDAILRFIGSHYGMMGSQPSFTDMYLEQVHDAEGGLSHAAYGKGSDAVLNWYQTVVPKYLKGFHPLISQSSNGFLSGGDEAQPSVADCRLYDFLFKLTVVQKQLGTTLTASILQEDADWVKSYMQRMEAIPSIQSHMASDSYMKGFMNNPSAKWRG